MQARLDFRLLFSGGALAACFGWASAQQVTGELGAPSAGKHTIVFDYKVDEPGLGKSGKGVLSADGREVARNSMEHGTPITFPEDETFDVRRDTRTGLARVEYRYDVPFVLTGKIDKLTFNLAPENLSGADREKLQQMAEAQARAKD